VVIGIMVVCGAGIVFAELHYGTLDVGYNLTDQWAALARVGFSFFTGVLIYRWLGEKEVKSPLAAWACVIVLGAALAIQVPDKLIPVYEIGMVLAGMPLLAIAAARFEPDAVSGRLFSFVGLISYGIYIVHQPLGNLVVMELHRVMRIPGDWRGVAFGAAFMAFLVLLNWALDVFYDAPVRKVLRAWFMPPHPRPAAVKAA